MTATTLCEITKSKFLEATRCEKLVEVVLNDDLPKPSPTVAMEVGNQVHALARELFPKGIFVTKEQTFQDVAAANVPLFELSITIPFALASEWTLRCRLDVLEPANDKWNLYEVKSSMEPKEDHYWDIAFQVYVLRSLGIPISECFLIHINKEYRRDGEIDHEKLFIRVNVTEEIQKRDIEGQIRKIISAAKQKQEKQIGCYCLKHSIIDRNVECPIKDLCWDFLPSPSVFDLMRIRKEIAFKLVSENKIRLEDIPDDALAKSGKLPEYQKIQLECHRKKKIHLDKKAIRDFLGKIAFPIYGVDLETFRMVLPLWDGTSPNTTIPFQVSLHVADSWNDLPRHSSFLSDGLTDPRPILLEKLTDLLGDRGVILAYNSAFEIARFKECIEAFPQYREQWEKNIFPRFLDLWIPFKEMSYYNPTIQMGSSSMKATLPALMNGYNAYSHLQIHDGAQASDDYYRSHFLDSKNKEAVRQNLERYCAQDTLGLIQIVQKLKELC
ncbi:MAG: DUF2779 domain-containing protein [Verrucomicrobiota bacterium]